MKGAGASLTTNEENGAEQAIAKQKQTEEAHTHKLFSSMTDMFEDVGIIYFGMELIYDKNGTPIDGIFRKVNSSTERLLGKSREQLIGKSRKELFGDVSDELPKKFDEVVKTGKPSHFESYGAALKKHYDIYAWQIGKNQVDVILRDITEQKKSEEELRRSEEKYSSLFSNMIDGLTYCRVLFDEQSHPVDLVCLEINDAFARITGLRKENVVGKTIKSVLPGIQKAHAKLFEISGRVALSNIPEKFEIFFKPLSLWVSVSLYSPKKGDVVIVFEDISERKKAEEKLLSKERELTSIYTSVPESLFFLTVNPEDGFCFSSVSQSFLHITGLQENQVVGKRVQEVIPEPSLSLVLEKYAEAIREGKTARWEEITDYPSGRKYGEVAVTPFFDSNGRCTNLIGSVYDVTERKKMEQEVSNSLEKSRRRESEISALLKASRAVLQNKEFPDSARAIFDVCKQLLGATAGYVALLSDNGKENIVLFLDSGGLPCTVDPSLPMPIRGLRAQAYNLGKVAIENDFPKSEWQKYSPKGHVQLDNVLFAPLMIEQRTVGVIGLANKKGGFTRRDAEMAKAFGELSSIALANSKMLEMLEENEKELKMHSEHLERLVEERTKQLKDAERLAAIGATAGMVGHDIRNPLQAITGDVYLAKTELASTPESEEKNNIQESLTEIERNIDYINKIVQDLQDYARPLNPNAGEADLKHIIDKVS